MEGFFAKIFQINSWTFISQFITLNENVCFSYDFPLSFWESVAYLDT